RPGAAASAPGNATAAARPPAPPPAPGSPPPFDTVVKDAKKIDGLFTLWQKDDKTWIELKPEDFGRPLLMAPKLSRGIGENGFFGGTMIGNWGSWGKTQMVEFRKYQQHVQLLARNASAVGAEKSPSAHAVAAGFSPSLIASAAIASAAHPERKTILIEANSLFMGDLLGLGISLQRTYRQNYAFDGRHSTLAKARARADAVFFDVQAHYATATVAMPQPGMPPYAVPSVPGNLPDARSLFMGLHYSLSELPAQPMRPRAADARVGYFSTGVMDFSDDLVRSPRQRFVNRWRLEKKDPAAALSEPVKPIVFWLDKTIPVKYREALTAGVLAWNPAFEKIGFKDAIQVKVQPDDADFDTLDVGVASIRWMTNAQPRFGAIGPSQVDPRSGEILDADIGFESLSSRGVRTIRSQLLTKAEDWQALLQAGVQHGDATARGFGSPLEHLFCQHGDMAFEQLGYALDVLEARGEVAPDSPEAEEWVRLYLTDTTIHEVGHTLGLRHNFRSSRIYTDAQLSDAEWVRKNGLAGSVMEYAPINLARPGAPATQGFQTVLGPYDYWAIEYAYKPMEPQAEAEELRRIAGRSAEPLLAYGTDEDNFLGIDPESLHFDLGDDPLQFADKRLTIARDLLQRQSTRNLDPKQDYAVLRRSVSYAVRDAARAVGVAMRQIGGLRTLRDHPGTGRDPLEPTPAAVQRQALDVIARGALAADALVVPPALQRKLAPDYQERGDAAFSGAAMQTDMPVTAMVTELQRALLEHLMSDGLAQRIIDAEAKVDRPADAFRLSELYGRILRDVWSDLAGSGDIPAARRALQREHVNKLAALVLRPAALSRADARSLVRSDAQTLLARVDAAVKRPGLSAESLAHLKDAADSLRESLSARLQRAGV
ncbi:MAG: zinc-dependent metalloprotease, partial [Aquabacterium sp.]